MASETDASSDRSAAALWRVPNAGRRSLEAWFDVNAERLLQQIARQPVRLAIGLLVVTRLVGGGLYSVFEEDADWFDGAWWVLVTQTTVGYGDFAPETFLGRATAELVLWCGILAVAILTAALAGVIAEHRIERARTAAHAQTTTLDDDFDHLIARLESDADYLAEHLRRLKAVTSDPRVVEALRVANLPKEGST